MAVRAKIATHEQTVVYVVQSNGDFAMNTLDILFVRACKAVDPHIRLQSLYYRFYGVTERTGNEDYITSVLSRICQEYDVISLNRFVAEIHPSNDWKHGEYPKAYSVLLSAIRLAPVSKFPGFNKPLKFRSENIGVLAKELSV